MNPLTRLLWGVTASIGLAGLVAAQNAEAAGNCELPASLSALRPEFVSVADGVEVWSFKSTEEQLQGLTLVRLDGRLWIPKLVDLRGHSATLSKLKRYAPPAYSLDEILELQPESAISISAGFTQTLNSPVPAGLLQINGVEHAPGYPKSRIMDGFVCIERNGSLSIQSRLLDGARRAPESADACRDAVQAGPVLVFDGQSQISSKQLLTARIALAIDSDRRLVLVHSKKASTYTLACALATQGLKMQSAIALQGDVYGGIAFSGELKGQVRSLGASDQVVASALSFTKEKAIARAGNTSPVARSLATSNQRGSVPVHPTPSNSALSPDTRGIANTQTSRAIKCEDLENKKCR